MAISAQVTRSDAYNVKRVEKAFELVVASNGSGTALIVNLDTTFLNAPQMTVIKPSGSAGTYTAVYDSTVPKITVDCTVETAFANLTARCILIAYDKP